MRLDPTPWPHTLLIFLLLQLTLPGDGNEGSAVGSCHCGERIPAGLPPGYTLVNHIQKYLESYDQCGLYVRFHLPRRKVCGGSDQPWVRELVNCFGRQECGRAHWKRRIDRKHLPPLSTLNPEPTEAASPVKSTLAQIHHTQPSTLPPGPLSSDNQFTVLSETITPTSAYSLGTGPEAVGNHKQKEENRAVTANTSAVVPVLSLLAIIFTLFGGTLFVLCKKRRRRQLEEYSSDWQHQYTDSHTLEP
ncbi:C-X-C motif chemokine 16 [Thomomys bottae]